MKVAVRRINEWDAPSMLKVYAPYIENTHYTPDTEVPKLSEYIQRIDTYTYGRGWIMTEVDGVTAGFCLLTDRDVEKGDWFTADIQLYVSPKYLRRGVGTSLYSLMLDIMHHANYHRVTAHINLPNDAAVAFHEKMGFKKVEEKDGILLMERAIEPEDPNAERFTKPYLIDNHDYERIREHAATLVREV
ncbi:MAG: GNAT family N-acetyltransferase [Clostridia bacterium]|nr:GNAT family N-acetyltransferase [Clostridia bacterium]